MAISAEPQFCGVCNRMILGATVHNACTCGAASGALAAERDAWRELYFASAHAFDPTCLSCHDDIDPETMEPWQMTCPGRIAHEKHRAMIEDALRSFHAKYPEP